MIEKRGMGVAGVVLGAALLGCLPTPSHADVDLFARRQACQAEAKTRIKAKGLQGRDLYEAVVERRKSYIAQCMVMGPQIPAATASTQTPPQPVATSAKPVKSTIR